MGNMVYSLLWVMQDLYHHRILQAVRLLSFNSGSNPVCKIDCHGVLKGQH